MTGFKSKRDMAEDKLLPQKDFGDALTIAYQSGYYDGKKAAAARDKLVQEAFDEWWDSNRKTLSPSNPCMTDSFEYWAWEGWHAALALTGTKCEVQPAQKCPNIKNCGGACFQCEYFNAEKGEMEYPVVQPAQEPVAWMNKDGWIGLYKQGDANIPLYTAPPQRPWVGLTDEEMHECAGEYPWTPTGLKSCRAIEAKLKEKNT